jgi:hypothetical protein
VTPVSAEGFASLHNLIKEDAAKEAIKGRGKRGRKRKSSALDADEPEPEPEVARMIEVSEP